MKKSLLYIFLISLVTILGVVFFQLGNCYPEHGTDTLNFCSTSSLVYFLWKSNLGGNILFFVAPVLSIILQVATFKVIFKESKSLLKSYLSSFIIPAIYSILFVALAGYRDIQSQSAELSLSTTIKWVLGVMVLSYVATFVARLLKR